MVEVIDETKQKKLDRLLSLLDPDNSLTKKDFLDYFQKVIDLVLQIQQKQAKAIDDLERTYQNLLNKMDSDHSSRYQELKGKVDHVFVKDRIDGIEGGMKSHMEEMKTEMKEMMDEMMSKMHQKMSSMKDGERGVMGPPGPMGPMPTEHLELMGELRAEMKKVQNVLSNIPRGGRAMGRAKVPMPRTIDLTSSQDGQARVFNVPPDTVRIHGGLSSQFPFAIASSDISRSGNQITLNDTIAPRERGQTLLIFTDALFYP